MTEQAVRECPPDPEVIALHDRVETVRRLTGTLDVLTRNKRQETLVRRHLLEHVGIGGQAHTA